MNVRRSRRALTDAVSDWLLLWLLLPVAMATEDVTDGGAVPPVQLPANIFPNYGEVEEDDPYRYYQPNYPAPRPVAPDDPALDPEADLRSADAYRRARSVEGGRRQDRTDGPSEERRRHRG